MIGYRAGGTHWRSSSSLPNTLQPDGTYQAVRSDAEGWYTATAISGLRVRMAWLLNSDRPDPLMTPAELRGLDTSAAKALRRTLLGP